MDNKRLLTFADIKGQDKAIAMLTRAVAGNTVSHAYLFRGPEGVGKKSVALAFASFLNCARPGDTGACGECPSCRKFASGNHPDVLHLEPPPGKRQLAIDQIRELKKALEYAPFEGGWRVVLLADIHATMPRAEVANSLLKTLEEPPERTVFILTADQGGFILDTILSRCQVVPFFPLSPATAAAILEAGGMEAARAQRLAAACHGSVTRARSAGIEETIDLAEEIAAFVLAPGDGDTWIGSMFALSERAAARKEDLPHLLDLLQGWLHALILTATGAPPATLPIAAGRECLWPPDLIEAHLGRVDEARRQLRHNCNRAAVCEGLLMGLAGRA